SHRCASGASSPLVAWRSWRVSSSGCGSRRPSSLVPHCLSDVGRPSRPARAPRRATHGRIGPNDSHARLERPELLGCNAHKLRRSRARRWTDMIAAGPAGTGDEHDASRPVWCRDGPWGPAGVPGLRVAAQIARSPPRTDMRTRSVVIALLSSSLASGSLASQQPQPQQQPSNRGPGGARGTQIQPGESCPPGTTEIRPRNCLGPEAPAPSILDYRPKSTLVAPVHMVKTAKYPAIDYHGHPQGLLASAEGLANLVAYLDSLNIRMMVAADNMSGDRLKNAMAVINASPKMKDRVRILAGINFQNVG